MIAVWMMYCLVCALGLGVAAVLAERALLVGSGSVRFVWLAAVLLSLVVPAAAFRMTPRSAPVNAAVLGDVVASSGQLGRIPDGSTGTSLPAGSPTTHRHVDAPLRLRVATLERFLSRLDEPFLIGWIVLSVAVALNFLGGVIALARMRRRWERRTVLGIPLLVSERTGPAVVGVLAPAIVLPEWSLAMASHQLALMLRHEQEHQRTGDGRLVAIAQIALVAMPWNVALWWQVRRLRVAVELDCDVRVLRDADARSYGDLLLEVARPRQGRLVGATAFAERATQLERRIRMLARHRVRPSRRARAAAVCIGCATVAVAWVAPHPAVPLGAEIRLMQTLSTGDSVRTATPIVAPVIATPPAVAFAAPRRVSRMDLPQPVVLSAPPEPIPLPRQACVLASGQPAPDPVSAIFDTLFDGIAIGPSQAVQACEQLTALHQLQQLEDQRMMSIFQANREVWVGLRAQRDSVLRTILTNDADRGTFDLNVAAMPAVAMRVGGGRGRSGGPPSDSVIHIRGTARVGGAGRGVFVGDSVVWMGRGARGGGGGRGAGSDSASAGSNPAGALRVLQARMVYLTVNSTFERLFAGITLSPDQESTARAVILKTAQETQPPMSPPILQMIPPFLRVNPQTGIVSMRAESAARLTALVGSDADREKLQSRIMIIP